MTDGSDRNDGLIEVGSRAGLEGKVVVGSATEFAETVRRMRPDTVFVDIAGTPQSRCSWKASFLHQLGFLNQLGPSVVDHYRQQSGSMADHFRDVAAVLEAVQDVGARVVGGSVRLSSNTGDVYLVYSTKQDSPHWRFTQDAAFDGWTDAVWRAERSGSDVVVHYLERPNRRFVDVVSARRHLVLLEEEASARWSPAAWEGGRPSYGALKRFKATQFHNLAGAVDLLEATGYQTNPFD